MNDDKIIFDEALKDYFLKLLFCFYLEYLKLYLERFFDDTSVQERLKNPIYLNLKEKNDVTL